VSSNDAELKEQLLGKLAIGGKFRFWLETKIRVVKRKWIY